MLCDYHIHSEASHDSSMPLLSSLARYAELGFDEICYTDHCESPTLHPSWRADFAAQHAFLEGLDGPVRVKKGLEVSMYPDELSTREIAAWLLALQPDFVIGSVHEWRDDRGDMIDPFMSTYYEGITAAEGYRRYLQQVLACARWHDFYDVVAHLDFPQKFYRGGAQGCEMLRYEHAPDEFDGIFRAVIAKGKGIELNSSVYRALKRPDMDLTWLRRYRELGGEVLTFGSDAHRLEHVGSGILEAREFAKAAGFTHFCTFERRQPTFHKI